jgi:hypothetical protein
MEIIAYIFAVAIIAILGACAAGPMTIGSMSKEEREDAGIVWKEDR